MLHLGLTGYFRIKKIYIGLSPPNNQILYSMYQNPFMYLCITLSNRLSSNIFNSTPNVNTLCCPEYNKYVKYIN